MVRSVSEFITPVERTALLLVAQARVDMRRLEEVVDEPKTLASRSESAICAAADAHLTPMTLAVMYAFILGKKAYKSGGATAAVKAVREGLLKSLPSVLLKALVAGGEAGLGLLPKRRAASNPEGINQYSHGAGLAGGHKLELSERGDTTFVHVRMSTGSASNMGRVTKQADGYHAHAADVKISGPHATKGEAVKAVLERSGFRHAELRTLKPKSPITIAFDVTSPEAIAWAREHAGELAKDISDTTEQNIKDAIAKGLEGGGLDEVYDDILDAIGDETRAEMIARTETMDAANEGLAQSWDQAREAGLLSADTKKQWIATASGACPECEEVDGEEVLLDEDFSVGDDPPLHPNCRCTMGLSFGGEE